MRRVLPHTLDLGLRFAQERLRGTYMPRKVRTLFVGESPPASGRFFYQADSGLYRSLRETFVAAFPHLSDGDDTAFLEAFSDLGCYLVDLCEQPVDRLPPGKRADACLKGEASLSRKLVRFEPELIVTVVRSIRPNVERAMAEAECLVPQVVVPYPGRWKHHQQAFLQRLVPILRSQLGPGKPAEAAATPAQVPARPE